MMTTLLAMLYLVLGLLAWHELLGRQVPPSAHSAWTHCAHPVAYVAIAFVTYLFAAHD